MLAQQEGRAPHSLGNTKVLRNCIDKIWMKRRNTKKEKRNTETKKRNPKEACQLSEWVGCGCSFFENTKVFKEHSGKLAPPLRLHALLTFLFLQIKSCFSIYFEKIMQYFETNDEEPSLMLLQLKSFDWILPLTPPLYRRQHHPASFSWINIILNK